MKIVFVSQPLSTGGAERVVASLANKFYELGHYVTIIVIDNGDQNVYPVNSNINFFHIKKIRNQLFDLIYRAFKIRKYLKNNKPDIVIPFTTQKNVSTLLATLFTKHKVIISERNNPYLDPKNKLLRFLRKLLYFKADGFVFQTIEAKGFFSKKIQNKSCIIPNPIKHDIIQPWNGLREKKIVMACRLNPQKNIEMAIEAMTIISKKYNDYSLEIYGKSYQGSNYYENYLKRIVASNGLEKVVIFKGFSHNIHDSIKDAMIFLITSNYEGMSNSLMEALAIGLPCVSTDDTNGGARSIIKDHINGILVPVGDTKKCIDALEELISNEKLRDTISENAIQIRENFSIDKIANRWIEFIQSII